MNTEKLEKLKKSLDNKFIPDNMKDKIRKEIAKLESDIKKDETITASEVKEEVKEIEKDVEKAIQIAEDKKEAVAKKTRAKRTPKATPSRTSKLKSTTRKKPTRTVMSVAKEIRKEGESWKDAQARARKTMKEDDTKVTKKVESELDKLNKLVKRRKELRGNVGKTNLLRDASRKALPAGKRISKEGNVYYENRFNRTDRGAYGKAYLAEGGYLTDPTFGQFQAQVYAKGGRVGEDSVIKDWYIKTYPTDDLGKELNDKSTFKDLLSAIFSGDDVYSVLGVGDSLIRERAFVKLSKIHKRYDSWAYEHWLDSSKYKNGGSVKNERRHVNHDEDYEIRYAKPRPSRTGYKGKRSFDEGGDVKKQQLKKGDDVLIIGRRWFDRANGNTYHTAEVVVNDKIIGKSRMSYGYEEQYIQTGKEILLDHFELPEGMKESSPLWQLREYGVDFRKRVTDGLKRDLELGGNLGGYDLAGHLDGTFNVGQNDGALSGFSNTSYSGLVGETGAMSSGEMFANGGGVRKVGNREYSYGRNWTNDHNHVNKGEEHEVNYKRKGKFLGMFSDGGGIEAKKSKYVQVHIVQGNYGSGWDDLTSHDKFLEAKKERKVYDENESYPHRVIKRRILRSDYEVGNYADGGDFQAGVYANGGGLDTPKIYVADLEAYNNGRLVGEWLDLSDYNDADELNDAIQELLDKWGVEEYAIHDAENLPSGMYSEYMGAKDFAELYEMMDLAKENDLPLAVVQEIVSQYDTDAVNNFYGKYDSAVDFTQQLVDDTGIQSFTDFERYLIISETDKRLLSQEMADNYVDDIKDEDDGERLIEEADLDLEEYQEADDDTREEMLDKAREIVYDRIYEDWETGLDDPYYFLVEEQGMYDAESFANANFVQIDYDAIADALEYDYTFVSHDGEVYVFDLH